jgi:trehalose/maltose hydrolase-like predicted phosphorylase
VRAVKNLIKKKSHSLRFAQGLKTAEIIKKSRSILNNFFPKELQNNFEVYYFNLKTGVLTIKTLNPIIASEIRLNEQKIQSFFKKNKIDLKKILIKNY